LVTGTEGTTVGTGVTGGKVAVGGAEDGLGWASVGAAVLGAVVAETDGDELGEDDAEDDGEGLADGAATCCDAITAAPRSSSATRATAAKTVKTVDHRSA
jgi:hypothetical protein